MSSPPDVPPPAGSALLGITHPAPLSLEANHPIRDGMPFKKMYQLREEVRKACANLVMAETLLANARSDPNYPPEAMEILLSDWRFKTAELTSLQKKLAPMEINFHKAQPQQKGLVRQAVAFPQPTKNQMTDGSEPQIHPSKQSLIAKKSTTMNADPPEVDSSPGACALATNECQYDHLDKLRHQYARPFELFCEEMDSIGDSCLTGICLALPDMPWSIAVSRLAFLLKSTLDSHGNQPSDTKYLSASTTIGCEKHACHIRLAELMTIRNWRDFMGWAHHHSHLINLCGQRSCINLKHMCLEPIDCMASRNKCRADSKGLAETARSPLECKSSGCWPACLPQHSAANILHSVAIEFAALHRVSFGPVPSAVTGKGLYTPISEHQLGKLVNDEDAGLAFPFHKSYGHIFVSKVEAGFFGDVDTLLQIPPMYTSEEMQSILQKLPTWTEVSFNGMLSSIFWYGRKRNMPYPVRGMWVANYLNPVSPAYQCPFCRGFDNDFHGRIIDFEYLLEAFRHVVLAHRNVSIARKAKFLYEEIQQCSSICDAWKTLLQEKYDASVASLAKGEIPQAVADLCGCKFVTDPVFAIVSKDAEEMEGGVKGEPERDDTAIVARDTPS
ncbi:hypothetical protein F5B22DRAFT_646998 [Xylaria bambusicola]|uniref:uncharacterized protein n=1 Tax=Xylaria bambusicola TaxID=326684 RepID=UPI00200730BE|nr:uncharacterized protein F5B22DRAFT_646998 [Xylaria bambusicola]KAI0515121.1 hypothetical protein F5B22DRAFT_646998 [Xylaria bambusicola]